MALKGPTPAVHHMCWWERQWQRAQPMAPGPRLQNANVHGANKSRGICWLLVWSQILCYGFITIYCYCPSNNCCAYSGDLPSTRGHRKRLCGRRQPETAWLHGDSGVRLPRWLSAGRKPSKSVSAGWKVVFKTILQWYVHAFWQNSLTNEFCQLEPQFITSLNWNWILVDP